MGTFFSHSSSEQITISSVINFERFIIWKKKVSASQVAL